VGSESTTGPTAPNTGRRRGFPQFGGDLSAALLNTIIALVTLAGLARILYRPKVQESVTYKATVVPLAEIMDVGFIVFSPVIILLFGYDATWAMLGLCLLAILTGFAISYNIKNYEPLIGKPDPLHRWNSIALWALLAASLVNVAYYAQLLMTLVWLPLGDLYSPGLVAATAAPLLGILTIYGFAKGLMALNDLRMPRSSAAVAATSPSE
jgi:hypothetical protein